MPSPRQREAKQQNPPHEGTRQAHRRHRLVEGVWEGVRAATEEKGPRAGCGRERKWL